MAKVIDEYDKHLKANPPRECADCKALVGGFCRQQGWKRYPGDVQLTPWCFTEKIEPVEVTIGLGK